MFLIRFPKTNLLNFKTTSQVSSVPIYQPLSEELDDLAVDDLSVQLALALGGSPVMVKAELDQQNGSDDAEGEPQVDETNVVRRKGPRRKVLPGKKTIDPT